MHPATDDIPKSTEAEAAADRAWRRYQEERDALRGDNAVLRHYQAQHPLWTTEMESLLPSEDEAGNSHDPICYYRLVSPCGSIEWYIMSARPIGDGTDKLLMGYAINRVHPTNSEVGYVTLSELRSIRGAFFLNVELDRYYGPQRLSDLRAGNER